MFCLKIELADTSSVVAAPFPEPVVFEECGSVTYFVTDMSRSYENKNESKGGTLLYGLQ